MSTGASLSRPGCRCRASLHRGGLLLSPVREDPAFPIFQGRNCGSEMGCYLLKITQQVNDGLRPRLRSEDRVLLWPQPVYPSPATALKGLEGALSFSAR